MSQKSNIPTILAQAMASEHTSYKSTKHILSQLHTSGRYVLQGPGENAGIVDLGKGYALAMRIESHNHPSFIKPYHGAATGVGGILRDIFTMGARPIALLDILRFGTDVRARRLLPEVVRGIADYGNCVGVPVVGGDLYVDSTYNHNCLVNVAAFGLVKKKNIIYGNALTVGNDLIYVGARTGRDGIGGAQMASENLDTHDVSTVQDADPFLEKLLLEACGELADTNMIEGMQDMGAAGLLCSTSEVVMRGRKKIGKNLGAKIYLNRVPTKTRGMSPVDMLLSESQERMLIVGHKKYRRDILAIFKRWDLEACVIGDVTDNGKYTIVYDTPAQKNIALAMDFSEIFPDVRENWDMRSWNAQDTKHIKASRKQTKQLWHQYDWMVGLRTIKGPDKPGRYAIINVPEIGKEIVIAWSSDEGISNRDPKTGIEHAFDTCHERLRSLSAIPLGLTNCLNFGHPRDSMGAFAQTVATLRDCSRATAIPVVSGNISLYNAYGSHSIKPTPVLVMAGVRKQIIA